MIPHKSVLLISRAVGEPAESGLAAGFPGGVKEKSEAAAGKVIQGESHRVFRSQGFPPGAIQVFKTNPAFRPGESDGRPQADFPRLPGNPGIFPLFLFMGFPRLHHQGISFYIPLNADQSVTANEQAKTGHITGPETFRVNSYLCRTAGEHGALRERVPGKFHGPADLVRADHIGAVPGFPAAFPRLMIDLPNVFQHRGSEIIIGIQRPCSPAGTGQVFEMLRSASPKTG